MAAVSSGDSTPAARSASAHARLPTTSSSNSWRSKPEETPKSKAAGSGAASNRPDQSVLETASEDIQWTVLDRSLVGLTFTTHRGAEAMRKNSRISRCLNASVCRIRWRHKRTWGLEDTARDALVDVGLSS